jgi:DNA-binding MarR family transcriptional regulator
VIGNGKSQHLDLLQRTAGLTAGQRLVVLMYAMLANDRTGAVDMTGKELAALLNLSPTVFSRTRKHLVEAGWLEECDRLGHIHYYRLTDKATGKEVVVHLRRTAN